MIWFKVVLTVIFSIGVVDNVFKTVKDINPAIRCGAAIASLIDIFLIFGIWNWL